MSVTEITVQSKSPPAPYQRFRTVWATAEVEFAYNGGQVLGIVAMYDRTTGRQLGLPEALDRLLCVRTLYGLDITGIRSALLTDAQEQLHWLDSAETNPYPSISIIAEGA